jgi:hypothetical protein
VLGLQEPERDQSRGGYGDEDVLLRWTKTPRARFTHIVNRIAVCVVGLFLQVCQRRARYEDLLAAYRLNQDLQAGYTMSS